MNQPVFHTIAMTDSYPLVCREWKPVGTVRGTIVCLHGIQSHGGWYDESCLRFAQRGYRVIFIDRRGSGLNTVKRGDTPSWQILIRDVESVIGYFNTPLPITLLAISWGAKLAVLIAHCPYPWLSKIVLLTPAICARVGYSKQEKIQIARAVFSRRAEHMFPVPIPGPSYFTHTKKWQDYIAADPNTLTTCTARFLYETNHINRLIHAPHPIQYPAFMLLAGDDKIVDNGRMRAYFSRYFSSPYNHCKMYEGCAHTLEFDNAELRFVDDIIGWIEFPDTLC
ncbi:alpha/beta fold hydrolase [bacterium]|nr:alpha/beta fold hydrolase [bacterium]